MRQAGARLLERHGGWAGYNDVKSLAAYGKTLYAGIVGHVFRSEDGGYTWQQVGSKLTYQGKEDIEDSGVRTFLILHEAIYVGSNGGLYRLRTGDRDWTKLGNGLVAFDFPSLVEHERTLYTGTDRGVFRSEDGGDSWMRANEGLVSASVGSLMILGNTIYAGTAGGVFRAPLE